MEGKKGFTIIELLIALVVLGIIFAGLMPLLANTVNKNKNARLRLVAYEAASEKLEEYREKKISSLQAGTEIFSVSALPNSTAVVTIEKPQTSLAAITTTISWNFSNKPQKVELKTYLYGSTQ
jgi:prepilin-type N-terminal cleavage/methylation domain-containing protein